MDKHNFPSHSKAFFAKQLLRLIAGFENLIGRNKAWASISTSVPPLWRKRTVKLSGALGAGLILLFGLLSFPSNRQQDVLFVVPAKGSWHLAQSLEQNDIISSAVLFRLGVLLNFSKKMKSGEYRISATDSYRDIIGKVSSGRTARFRFTIPEGLSNYDIRETLRINTILSGEMLDMPDEGTILPETYFVRRGRSRASVVRQMHRAHKRLVSALWEKRSPNLPFKTKEEAVILASIVEKETGIAGEREEIAGVFANRLNKKHYMQLQSDPTVIYAIARGKPFDRSLTYKDLRIDDPYNSYKNYGLPPGAIANPGRAAIQAVLNPAKTKNFYFVADGTGGHAFAETHQQHLENVKKWRALQQAATPAQPEKGSEVAGAEEEAVATN